MNEVEVKSIKAADAGEATGLTRLRGTRGLRELERQALLGSRSSCSTRCRARLGAPGWPDDSAMAERYKGSGVETT